MSGAYGHAIGAMIIVMMTLFIAIWVWAWLPRHQTNFRKMAVIPCEDSVEVSEQAGKGKAT